MHTDQRTVCTSCSREATRATQTHSLREGSQLPVSSKDWHQHRLAPESRRKRPCLSQPTYPSEAPSLLPSMN